MRIVLAPKIGLFAGAALALSSAAALAQAPAREAASPLGPILADEAGRTLYVYDRDEPGVSHCYDMCATNWPPFLAATDARPEGDWTLVQRTDGSAMWAYKGRPLYYWVNDREPGQVTGDGVGGVWHAAMP